MLTVWIRKLFYNIPVYAIPICLHHPNSFFYYFERFLEFKHIHESERSEINFIRYCILSQIIKSFWQYALIKSVLWKVSYTVIRIKSNHTYRYLPIYFIMNDWKKSNTDYHKSLRLILFHQFLQDPKSSETIYDIPVYPIPVAGTGIIRILSLLYYYYWTVLLEFKHINWIRANHRLQSCNFSWFYEKVSLLEVLIIILVEIEKKVGWTDPV